MNALLTKIEELAPGYFEAIDALEKQLQTQKDIERNKEIQELLQKVVQQVSAMSIVDKVLYDIKGRE